MKFLSVISAMMLPAALYAAGASTAHFSHFDYKGFDDYYAENPLSSPSQLYNPILPGWNSDPSICRTGDDYWLVTSTFGYFPGLPLYHSKDLVNWTLERNVLDRPSQLPYLKGQSLDKGGIYAPHISYNPHNGKYYVVATDTGLKEGHFYVTATDPAGDWSDPVWLKGIDGIDPSFFFDDDGSAYIVYKEDTTGKPRWSNYRCIRFIAFDTEAGQTTGESWPLDEAGVAPHERLERDEGPHIYKIDGTYYLLCAEGGTSTNHSAVIFKADNIRGPYHRWGRNPMLTQRGLKDKRTNPVTCAGHADLVQTPEGDWWAVFLGCRPGPGKFQALGRETFMMPVLWSGDRYPYLTQCEDTVPMVIERPGTVRDDSKASSGNFGWRDDFTTDALRPEWMSLRGSIADRVSPGNGSLSLQCSPEPSTGKGVPSYLGRRIQHHKFEAATEVKFKPAGDNERAGLMILKNEGAQYFLAVGKGSVSLHRIGRKGRDVLASAPLRSNKKAVGLKVVSDGINYTFSFNDGNAWQVLADNVDASHVACERTGGFTGATIGLYAEQTD